MKKIIFLFTSLSLLLAATHAQKFENRDLKPFDAVNAFGNMSVILVQGEEEKVEIKIQSESNIPLSNVTTEVEEMALKIRLTSELFKAADKVTVTVTYKKIRRLVAGGSADMMSEELFTGDKLTLKANTGGNIYIDVDVESIDASVNQGSVIGVDGYTKSQVVEVAQGATYSGYDLDCDNTYVKANTKGIAKVIVNNLLEARATTGGYIGYGGKPKKKDIKETLGGEVEFVEQETNF